MNDRHQEWRILTPILLGLLTVIVLPVLGFFMTDKLNAMNDKSDKLFSIVGSIKNSFDDYRITAEHRFSTIETKLDDISKK